MKSLYEFTVDKIAEVEKTEELADGSKVTKKVKENVPVSFILKKPSRLEVDAGDVFYNVDFGKNVRAGMLTTALVDKMYGNEGGVFSKIEIEEYASSYVKLGENLGKVFDLEKADSKTPEDSVKLEELYEENTKLRQTISSYENARNSIYNNTAEVTARNKTLFWWLLTMIYQKDGEKFTPLFPGETYDKKGESYDKIAELAESEDANSKYYTELIAKSSSLVSLWFMSKVSTAEEFAEIAKDYLASTEEDKEVE